MNLLLLLCGVADPKWPLPPTIDTASLAAHRAAHPVLSPFDEAALELALKWRDVDTGTRIHALVGATSAQDALLRRVACWRLDTVEGLDLAAHPAWDACGWVATVASWITSLQPQPDLVLIGREFGDEDDGCVPALLAAALGRPLIGQTLELERSTAGLRALRPHATGLERLHAPLPTVAAVTNHAGNKLRHPLLKNVMAARRASFSMATLPCAPAPSAPLRLAGLAATVVPARASACRMIEGSPQQQAAELARLLLEEARA